jgi:hypothetical protein
MIVAPPIKVSGSTTVALDNRSVNPDATTTEISTLPGLVKVLFSVINGDNRDFYIGGDRAIPTKIFSLPVLLSINSAYITSTGSSKSNWIVSIYVNQVNLY